MNAELQKSFDAIVSPELREAVERCAMKHNLLIEPLKVEVVAALLQAAMLQLVEEGGVEIVGCSKGNLIFRHVS